MTIHEDYFNYTLKWQREYGEKTIVFVKLGAFYEVYALQDDNTTYGSKIVECSNINKLDIAPKNVTVQGPIKDIVDENKPYQVVMAGFTATRLTECVNNMSKEGFKVVTCRADSHGNFICDGCSRDAGSTIC